MRRAPLPACSFESRISRYQAVARTDRRYASRLTIPVLQLGLPDDFVEHGEPAGLLAECCLSAEAIVQRVQELLAG